MRDWWNQSAGRDIMRGGRRWCWCLTSRNAGELMQRHRDKQGQENGRKGLLTEFGLHHLPCKSYSAN